MIWEVKSPKSMVIKTSLTVVIFFVLTWWIMSLHEISHRVWEVKWHFTHACVNSRFWRQIASVRSNKVEFLKDFYTSSRLIWNSRKDVRIQYVIGRLGGLFSEDIVTSLALLRNIYGWQKASKTKEITKIRVL